MNYGRRRSEESYRSSIVEEFCPHVGKRVLGFRTYRLEEERPAGEAGQPILRRELVHAFCLHRETCQHLGCVTGLDPFAR